MLKIDIQHEYNTRSKKMLNLNAMKLYLYLVKEL